MFVSPYSRAHAVGADITLGWPGTTTNTAGIPAAPQGFYIPPGFKHLFYTDNGSARAESGALLLRAASPGVGWLPDVVPQLKARVGDSAVDMTGTRMHLLRLVQAWGDKGLFTVLIAQGGLSAQYGSYPDLDSMTFEAFPPSALPQIKNQPGVFIVGLPNNEPSTAAAWDKYAALTGTATGSTPGGGVVLPTPKCPPKGVFNGTTCDCKALGPTAVFDGVSFLCIDCGPNTVPYKQGSKVCDCLPGFVPYGSEGGGCVPATGVVTPGNLPVPNPPQPAPVIAMGGNPLSNWWALLTDREKKVAAVTGLVSGGILAWLFLHGTKERGGAAADYNDDWAHQDTWRDPPRSAGAAPRTWVSPR